MHMDVLDIHTAPITACISRANRKTATCLGVVGPKWVEPPTPRPPPHPHPPPQSRGEARLAILPMVRVEGETALHARVPHAFRC